MPKSIRLDDLQLILLSTAAGRDNGSLFPLPETITQSPSRMDGAIKALLKRQFVAELPVTDRALAASDMNDEPTGIFISEAGRIALGVVDGRDAANAVNNGVNEASHEPAPAVPTSKAERMLILLMRMEGATLAEMIEVTGWLPHTTRAHLTALRKKGHSLEKRKRADVTCYRIARTN